ncbi:kinase-like protein [Plenodomus tracheiphilus IPT5]|uniref:Kinase-like protein n=1 Tax=Plenodomus tracheiphilus IPT5 TaxID=1408161 RepID=A0A6A7BG11_9PLEO|nr:kinase-like protein [Plenodomus tracheiphilus IPT5]
MDTTVPEFDLTTVEGLRAYLTAKGQYRDDEIVILSGGTANYVYRATTTKNSTRVYKHAAPHSHSNKTFALDIRRMDYEALILDLLSSTNPRSPLLQQSLQSTAQAVPLLSYDQEHKLLCIADGGPRNLKSAYTDPQLDMQNIGARLAHWLAMLHSNTKYTSLTLPSQTHASKPSNDNNPIALQLYRHSYNNLHIALSEYNHDAELGVEINKQFGSLLATDEECICHGDFWPGNILIQNSNTQEHTGGLTVVDWELVRRGTSATDVGQFAAEAFLLDRFMGGRGLLGAFLGAYVGVRGAGVDKGWVRRMVVHWAVHVAYWPTRVAWTDQEGTQGLVNMGVEVLRAVLEDEWEGLGELALLGGVKGVIGGVLV